MNRKDNDNLKNETVRTFSKFKNDSLETHVHFMEILWKKVLISGYLDIIILFYAVQKIIYIKFVIYTLYRFYN